MTKTVHFVIYNNQLGNRVEEGYTTVEAAASRASELGITSTIESRDIVVADPE